MSKSRDFDVVLLGATGFTGGLTAEYLAANAPASLRWAIAGRDRAKLLLVRDRLAAIESRCADLPVLVVDSDDPAGLSQMVRRTRVVASTVGPYLAYGEQLVAACAVAGTDYVDLTGEPEFVDVVYTRYHDAAVESGARIVHACGFDSIPYDLGVLFTLQHLNGESPISVSGFIRAGGEMSGGTLQSALLHLSRQPQAVAAARRRRAAEPTLSGRTVRHRFGMPHYDRVARAWAAPLPTIDPRIVAMSARLIDGYGADFTYRHYAAAKSLRTIVLGGAALTGVAIAAQVPPLRRALGRVQPPGNGPSAEQREVGWFTARFHATSATDEVVTEISGGDPAYGETSKMLAEAVMCLALDDLPITSGQTTTAAAMGVSLIRRLQAAGIEFRVLNTIPKTPPSRRRPASSETKVMQ